MAMELLAKVIGIVLLWCAELLPEFLYQRVVSRAAEKNRRKFEEADPNSMAAWKHFPW